MWVSNFETKSDKYEIHAQPVNFTLTSFESFRWSEMKTVEFSKISQNPLFVLSYYWLSYYSAWPCVDGFKTILSFFQPLRQVWLLLRARKSLKKLNTFVRSASPSTATSATSSCTWSPTTMITSKSSETKCWVQLWRHVTVSYSYGRCHQHFAYPFYAFSSRFTQLFVAHAHGIVGQAYFVHKVINKLCQSLAVHILVGFEESTSVHYFKDTVCSGLILNKCFSFFSDSASSLYTCSICAR